MAREIASLKSNWQLQNRVTEPGFEAMKISKFSDFSLQLGKNHLT